MTIKDNGCNEDGWDLFEEQTRQEFEYYACRRGYDLYKHPDYPWQYFNTRTDDAWGDVSSRACERENLE